MVEDRGIGCESGDGELVDVSLERAAVQQVAGNVVEPQTLTLMVEKLCCFHPVTSWFAKLFRPRGLGRHPAPSTRAHDGCRFTAGSPCARCCFHSPWRSGLPYPT